MASKQIKSNLQIDGTLAASNLSGTNTGDQDLSEYALKDDQKIIIDDNIPTAVNGEMWFQPTEGKFAVGIDDNWIAVSGEKGDTGEQGIQGIQGEKGDDYQSTQIPNITLLATNWNLVGGYWEYDYANALITATSIVDIVPYKETIDYVKFADIMPMAISGVGTVKIYATNQPIADINVLIKIV